MLRLDWNLVFTIINLIILYLILKKLLIGPVTGIIEKRQAMIKAQLDDAASKEVQAQELKGRYETALFHAREESNALVENARNRAKTEYERIVHDAKKEASRVKKEAEKDIAAEKENTIRKLESQIAELAITTAEKMLSGQTEKCTENDRALYDQFLKKAGESDDTDHR